nr:P-type conjugative transfer protein TrbL [uncultured Ralstonia sp.]
MRFFLEVRDWLTVAVIVVAATLGLQSSALAQSANAVGVNQVSSRIAPMQASSGTLDGIVRDFTIAANGWSSQLQSLALNLFMLLVGISTCWTVISMALKNEDFSSIVFELCWFFIFSGFFLWLLQSSGLGLDLANSVSEVANRATGRNIRGPDDVLKIGLDVFKLATSNFSVLHISNSLSFFFIGLIFLICSAVMAVNFMMLQIMIHLLAIGGVFFLGFGGSRWTSDVALSYYRTCLSAGAQLMGMIFIVSVGYNILDAQFKYASTNFDLMFGARMLVIGIVFFMLSLKVPNALAQLVSALGSSAADVNRAGRALHMSKVVGAAAGVAVGAVGGAVVGAKAAAAGAKGATASKGGGEAGKSVADGIGKLADGGKELGESVGKKSVHAETGKGGGGSQRQGQQGQAKQGATAGRASGTRTAGSRHASASDMRNAIRSGIRGMEQRIPTGLKGGLKGARKGALSAARTAMDGNLGGIGAFHKTLSAGLKAVPRKSAAAASDQQAAGRPPEALGDAAASASRGDAAALAGRGAAPAGLGDANPAAHSHTPSSARAIGQDVDGAPAESMGQRERGGPEAAVEAPAARDLADQASPDQSRRESLHDQHVQDWMTDDGQPLLEGAARRRHIALSSAAPRGDTRPAEEGASSVPYQRLVSQPSSEPSARAVPHAPAADYAASPPPANGNSASRQTPLHASSGTSSVANHGGVGNGMRGAGQAGPVKHDMPYVRLPEAPPVQSGRRGSGTSQQGLLHASGGTPSPSTSRATNSGGTRSAAPTVSAGVSPSHAQRSETPPAQSGARSGGVSQHASARGSDGAPAVSSGQTGNSGLAPSARTVSAGGSPSHAQRSETPPAQSGARSGGISQHASARGSDGAPAVSSGQTGNSGLAPSARTVSAGGSPSHAQRSETPPAQSGARSGGISQHASARGSDGAPSVSSGQTGSGGLAPSAPLSESPPAQSGAHSGDGSQRTLVHTKSNASDGADSGVGSPVSPISPVGPADDEPRDAQGLIQDDAALVATAEPPPDASLDDVSARGFWVERRTASRSGEGSQDTQDQAPS